MDRNFQNIKVIALDADDTLWINERFFREGEDKFYKLMSDFMEEDKVAKILFDTEMKNLPIYGYGIKGFVLSMTEAAINISNNKVSNETIENILDIGKEMLHKKVELLPDVEEVLSALQNDYILIVATKGDLLDQQRKLKKSGLEKYFEQVEVMSDKKEDDYKKILRRLNINPEEFLMIGNSLKSDVLPVFEIGAQAIHVPHEITWQHEEVTDHEIEELIQLDRLGEVLSFFSK